MTNKLKLCLIVTRVCLQTHRRQFCNVQKDSVSCKQQETPKTTSVRFGLKIESHENKYNL